MKHLREEIITEQKLQQQEQRIGKQNNLDQLLSKLSARIYSERQFSSQTTTSLAQSSSTSKKKKRSHSSALLSFVNQIQKQQQIVKIPPIPEDIYCMSMVHTTQTSILNQNNFHMQREFHTSVIGDTYWDSVTFELLAFSDNLCFFVGKSKQDLIEKPFTLIDATPPENIETSKAFFPEMVRRKVHCFETFGPFYRACDCRINFAHERLHFDIPGIIRAEFFVDQFDHIFIVDGSEEVTIAELEPDLNQIPEILKNHVFISRFQPLMERFFASSQKIIP